MGPIESRSLLRKCFSMTVGLAFALAFAIAPVTAQVKDLGSFDQGPEAAARGTEMAWQSFRSLNADSAPKFGGGGVVACAADVPVPIPDLATVVSQISLPDVGPVSEVEVYIRVNHTFTTDLRLNLISPAATSVLLSNRRGGSGDSYGLFDDPVTTLPDSGFDDDATRSIATGSTPFLGTWQPEQPLSALDGEGTAGVWQLQIADLASGDSGQIVRFCLAVNDPPQTQPPVVQLDLIRSATLDPGVDGRADAGDLINYGFEVQNTGDVALNDIIVSESLGTSINCPGGNPIGMLGAGMSVSCSGSYALTQADIDAGAVNSTATAIVQGVDSYCDATLPIPLPDTACRYAQFQPKYGTVSDVDMNIYLTHPFTADLRLSLVSPAGTEVLLANRRGGAGDNYGSTADDGSGLPDSAFNDEGVDGPITAASAPFIGSFVPESPLSAVDGEPAGGRWIFVGCDLAARDTGTMQAACLTIERDGPGDQALSSQPIVQVPMLELVKTGALDLGANGISDPGDLINYNFVVSNAGNVTISAIAVGDNLVATISCPSGNPIPSLAPGSSEGCTGSYALTLADIAAGTVNNTATAAGNDPGANPIIASDSHSEPIPPVADIQVSKTNGVTSATPGESIIYTIVVSNAGPNGDPAVALSDPFPAVLTCTYTSAAAGGASGNTAAGAGNLTDTLSLPAGSSVTYMADCAIDPATTGSLSNTATAVASIADSNLANNSATDTDTLTPQADLVVTKDDGVSNATPGGTVTWAIVASNAGPSDAVGATVSDSFPAACTSVTWTCVGAGGGTCAAGGSGTIADTIDLPVGGTATYSATCAIDPAATGMLDNTATIAVAAGSTDPNAGNNSATDSDTLTPQADLSITKVDQGVPVPTLIGSSFSYLLTVSNAGPSTATNVVVTDSLPSTLSYVSNSCGASFAAPTLSWNVGTLAPATNASCTINVTVASLGGISNTASATSATADPTPANNAATNTLTGAQAVDVAISLTADAGAGLAVGDSFTYTVTGTNLGVGLAGGLEFTLELSGKVSFVSSSCGAVLAGNTLSWSVATLADGASTSCDITVVVVLAGDIQASANVTTATFDPNLANNTAELAVSVSAIPIPALDRFGLLLLMLLSAGLGLIMIGRARSA